MSSVAADGISHLFESDITESSAVASSIGPATNVANWRRNRPPNLTRVPPLRRSSTWRSPSSPSLKLEHDIVSPSIASPGSLTRSKTLPRGLDQNSEWRELILEKEVIAKLRRWILALVVVEFDLDLGPEIRSMYPSLQLTPAEIQNIAFSSFPDSLQFDQGSQAHSFRIRAHQDSLAKVTARPGDTWPMDWFIYGFSHFTQRRETTLARGYRQRSLVILTNHQYPSLFSVVISALGPLYESHGTTILEAVCHNIGSWPDPTPGSTLELPLLGNILRTELPQTVDSQQLTETSSFEEAYNPDHHILALSAPFSPPLLMLFEASLTHLWSIWECLVLCEPILVFGPSPAFTSQAIWFLRDILRPIPLSGDFRPYFTIHDKDHSLLVNKMPPKAGLLLGVTNPIFEKLCGHWPHVLSLGRPSWILKTSTATAGPAPGWKTRTHRRYISKDLHLLAQLEAACVMKDESKMDASLLLRRHFCSRTNAFLVPLNRYLNSLIPSPTECLGAASAKIFPLKPFNVTNFFASLKGHGSPLPFRSSGKQKEFYKRWLKTPAFGVWLARQEEVVYRVLQESYEREMMTVTE